MSATKPGPHVVVFSSLFPSQHQPGAGLFVRERMFRVGDELPLSVVSPTPWFPFQSLIRHFRRHFRPGAPAFEKQCGFAVWFPRFLSFPKVLKRLDGLLMALGAAPRLRRLKREGRLDILDAHFGYPDGYAATLLGRWLDVPVTITLRGTEARQAKDPELAPLLQAALRRAARVFAVSQSLREVAIGLGVASEHVLVVGNGVDLARFSPIPRAEARRALGLPIDARVLVTVGGLVERKGMHRVIELLPQLRAEFPGLVYLIVGGPSREGDMTEALQRQVAESGLGDRVRFLGALPPEELRVPLSAADVFVLATRNEGWANVLLEAMACGLPIVTTDVGGNSEVVCAPSLGILVPFGDPVRLTSALQEALGTRWDASVIREHARRNTWSQRVDMLVTEFRALHRERLARRSESARARHA